MIVAYHIQDTEAGVAITKSTGERIVSNDLKQLLAFLLAGDGIKVTWDIDQAIAPILRRLDRFHIEQLAETNHCFIPPFNLNYYRQKLFIIHSFKFRTEIFHLSQYFVDDHEPQTILALAIKGQELLDNLKLIGMEATRLTSPAKLAETEVLAKMEYVPTAWDIPADSTEVLDYADIARGRSWVSAYQLGYWAENEIFDYDISACYPYELSQCYNTRYAEYIKSDKMIKADTGFLFGQATITSPISPIVRRQDDSLIAPCGSFYDVFTLEEIKFIEKWNLGSFELDKGWFINFTRYEQPFEEPMIRLFKLRETNSLINNLVKRMSASVWGKLGEIHDSGELGPYFNPIISALVTARARLRVAEFIFSNKLEHDLVSVTIDGCLVTREVTLPLANSIGSWRLASRGPALIVSSGRQFLPGKRPGGLTLENLLGMIAAKPDIAYYATTLTRPSTLVDVLENDLDLNEIGKVREFHTSIDLITAEHDRVFGKQPYTGRQLLARHYASKPIELRQKGGDTE